MNINLVFVILKKKLVVHYLEFVFSKKKKIDNFLKFKLAA